jgi:hypothetical protein
LESFSNYNGTIRTEAGLLAAGPGDYWTVELNTSVLLPGIAYELCIDPDGDDTVYADDGTGLEVYVSGVMELRRHAVEKLPLQQLELFCELCSVETEIYLATSCDASLSVGASRTPTVSVQDGTSSIWSAWIDASALTLGNHYWLCIDMDGTSGPGSGIGNAGQKVYVTAIASLLDGGVTPASNSSKLWLQCSTSEACGSAAHVYLATACDSAAVSAASNGSDSSAAALGSRQSGVANMQTTTGSFQERHVFLNTSMLQTGRHYKLCLDIDGIFGPGSTFLLAGDSGVSVYVTPLPGDLAPVTVKIHVPHFFPLDACVGCNSNSMAYLAASCIPIFGAEQYPLATRLQLLNQTWRLYIPHQSPLQPDVPFSYYKLCLDLDGPTGYLQVGDSGQDVYVSGVPFNTTVIRVAASTTISTSCYGCPWNTSLSATVRLSVQCDPAVSDGFASSHFPESTASASLLPYASSWSAVLDTSGLQAGQAFRLCVDGDGLGPKREGDAVWVVYLSPIVLETTVVHAGSSSVQIWLKCSPAGSCSERSQVELALRCDRKADFVTLGIVSPIRFMAIIPSTYLLAGQHYKLCADLDGDTTELPLIDSGEVVYISPVLSVSPIVLRPLTHGGQASLAVTCASDAGCSTATEAFLSTDCATNSTANATVSTNFTFDMNGLGAPFWRVELDISGLTIGIVYKLCVDVDGSQGDLMIGSSGFELFATVVSSRKPVGIIAGTMQHVVVQCDGSCGIMWG